MRQKSRRSDVAAKVSISSENLNFSLPSDDELSFKGSSDYLRELEVDTACVGGNC